MKKMYYPVVFLLISISIFGQQGKTQSQLWNAGKITTNVGNNATLRSMILQPDGKLIAVGNIDSSFVIVRYRQNGQLDNSFGISGKVYTPFNFDCAANAVQLTSDGSILVAGSSSKIEFSTVASDILLVCYNSDGSLKTSFGTNGLVQTDISLVDYGSSMRVLDDGKILVSGTSTNVIANGDVITLRYNSDGSLDETFGVNGYVIKNLGSVQFPSDDHAAALDIQVDGKIVVGGNKGVHMFIIRYNPDGTYDNTFGNNGVLTGGLLNGITSLFVKDDGKIVAAGHFNNDEDISVPSITRLESDGAIDESFGVNGRILSLPYYSYFEGRLFNVVQQTDGKILAVGSRTDLSNQQHFESIARYAVNGHKDLSFGNNGSLTVAGDQGIYPSNSNLYPVVIINDGSILMGSDLNNDFIIYKVAENAGKSIATDENNANQREFAISIYPNPIQEKFYIKGIDLANASDITISDMQGNVLIKEQLNKGQAAVNVHQLKQGNYILHVQQGTKSASAIFLKQ
ncbi:MAG: T9SS type A sorting domain-containing protein [Bacteroidetes bacterium]|nr:T9SS type A sorting domain-containing protein [Bacteroidota bacterium]